MAYRIVILVSGRGSNMEAILKASRDGRLPGVEVALVASDKADAPALEIARGYGVKAEYIDPGAFKTKLEGEGEARFIARIQKAKPDLLVLAGFMRIIKPAFIKAFEGRIINIHPSLLPDFPGLHTHARALEAGKTEAGCTVHYVNEITDGGKRIMQARVPVVPGDTEETLAARVLAKEHQMFQLVIRMKSEGKLAENTLGDEPLRLEDYL